MCLFLSMVVWRGCFLKWISGWMLADTSRCTLPICWNTRSPESVAEKFRVHLPNLANEFTSLEQTSNNPSQYFPYLDLSSDVLLLTSPLYFINLTLFSPFLLPITCNDEYFVCMCVCMYEGVQEKGWKSYPKKSEYRGLFQPNPKSSPLTVFLLVMSVHV